jgi:tetratricopeptide (TPR) repeat protein
LTVLAVLVLVHLAALALYLLKQTQAGYLARVLDAREQWRDGNLETAAALYRDYAENFPRFSWPVVLFDDFPSRGRAWYALGRIEAERDRVDEALAAFRNAMAEEPGLGQREFRNLLLESARPGELAKDATTRLARDAADLAAWFDLGAARLAQNEPGAAEAAYAAALVHLPRWLRLHTRGGGAPGLTAEEGDLRGLRAVAALRAGNADLARAECASLARRERPEERYDQLCAAYLLAADGDLKAARERLNGYVPSGAEHAALAKAITGPGKAGRSGSTED